MSGEGLPAWFVFQYLDGPALVSRTIHAEPVPVGAVPRVLAVYVGGECVVSIPFDVAVPAMKLSSAEYRAAYSAGVREGRRRERRRIVRRLRKSVGLKP